MSIIHNTSVDFTRRVISEPVHIVQGDRTLPTLAVELLSDGQPYTVPDGAQVNIALDKKDGTFVLNKADSVDGNIATFTIPAQMAAVAGDFTPEVQIVNGAGQATTGKFPYIVDKAEIQEGMLESTSEGTALISYVDKAEAAADRAEDAAKVIADECARPSLAPKDTGELFEAGSLRALKPFLLPLVRRIAVEWEDIYVNSVVHWQVRKRTLHEGRVRIPKLRKQVREGGIGLIIL